ncbi:hypothetical protein PR048_012693 [Dryococelus australis]|uniref:Uncharacterized protein n=1 Tax=Dryococelus australis TaxID=614101 RepID=A0ABQ9HQ54_9NEOP|nr:hypothetical protein PR048_012693 [Dryococelus australis]
MVQCQVVATCVGECQAGHRPAIQEVSCIIATKVYPLNPDGQKNVNVLRQQFPYFQQRILQFVRHRDQLIDKYLSQRQGAWIEEKKRTQAIILLRLDSLPEEEQGLLAEKLRNKEVNSIQEQNQMIMVLLRAHCETKQARHVHDTPENRSEFLNQYLGGSTIFMKAKRSLTSSFDQLLKRKGPRDDYGPIVKEISLPMNATLCKDVGLEDDVHKISWIDRILMACSHLEAQRTPEQQSFIDVINDDRSMGTRREATKWRYPLTWETEWGRSVNRNQCSQIRGWQADSPYWCRATRSGEGRLTKRGPYDGQTSWQESTEQRAYYHFGGHVHSYMRIVFPGEHGVFQHDMHLATRLEVTARGLKSTIKT